MPGNQYTPGKAFEEKQIHTLTEFGFVLKQNYNILTICLVHRGIIYVISLIPIMYVILISNSAL